MGLRIHYTPEQMINFLREAEVSLAQGRPDEDALTRSIIALAA